MLRFIQTCLPVLTYAICVQSCAKQAYYIDTFTNRDEVGNYVIKWEVRPGMEGRVELFASDDPYSFPTRPFATESIGKQVSTYITEDNFSRKFFLLVFDRDEMVVAGAKVIPTFGVTNLRDIGGYQALSGEYVSWGKVYRSGRLTNLSYRDSLMVDRLGINTRLILSDMRSPTVLPSSTGSMKSYLLRADRDNDRMELLRKVLAGEADARDVRRANDRYLRHLAFNNVAQYRTALEYMNEKRRYPILISDSWGKDRAAFFIVMIQSILNMNRSDILDDYLMSNNLLQVERMVPGGYRMDPSIQEALTEFFRCRSDDLNEIISEIERKYGSMGKYIEKVYGFSLSQQNHLRSLLLDL